MLLALMQSTVEMLLLGVPAACFVAAWHVCRPSTAAPRSCWHILESGVSASLQAASFWLLLLSACWSPLDELKGAYPCPCQILLSLSDHDEKSREPDGPCRMPPACCCHGVGHICCLYHAWSFDDPAHAFLDFLDICDVLLSGSSCHDQYDAYLCHICQHHDVISHGLWTCVHAQMRTYGWSPCHCCHASDQTCCPCVHGHVVKMIRPALCDGLHQNLSAWYTCWTCWHGEHRHGHFWRRICSSLDGGLFLEHACCCACCACQSATCPILRVTRSGGAFYHICLLERFDYGCAFERPGGQLLEDHSLEILWAAVPLLATCWPCVAA